MHISYFYDIPLPTQLAAPIQILNTCRALCELGAQVTVYTNRITAPSIAACLAFYGLAPHPRLRIVPLFAAPRHSRLQRALVTALDSVPASARHIIISRGEPGIELFRRLRHMPRQINRRYLYEAHKLCFVHATEQAATPFRWLNSYRNLRIRAHERRAVALADGLICLTEGVQTAIADAFGIVKPTLILSSGTSQPNTLPQDDAGRDIAVLYAGKLEQRKGLSDLIAAMQFLPEYRLWMIGGTPAQIAGWQQHAHQLGVGEQVVFTGFLEPRAMAAWYQRARVGVCPLPVGESAISETFTSPLKVLDMMAAGVPIVGTDVPALRTLLDHNRTALLVSPNSPTALATAIRQLLEDRALATRLACAAWQNVAAFTWEQRAQRLLTFLQSFDTSGQQA